MKPTAKQRLALHQIETGQGADPESIPWLCQIQGGFGNEAEFLYRLMCRGWVGLVLTEKGRQALEE